MLVVSCPNVHVATGQVEYSSVSVNGRFHVNTVAEIQCPADHSLSGSETVTCQDSGQWNPNVPTCNKVQQGMK